MSLKQSLAAFHDKSSNAKKIDIKTLYYLSSNINIILLINALILNKNQSKTS